MPVIPATVWAQSAAHGWPGNVRELQNVLERSMILAQGGPLRVDLPSAPTVRVADPVASGLPAESAPWWTRAELKRQERQGMEAALARAGGRVFGPQGAAALLGMKSTTLASRIKALGIRNPRGNAPG